MLCLVSLLLASCSDFSNLDTHFGVSLAAAPAEERETEINPNRELYIFVIRFIDKISR